MSRSTHPTLRRTARGAVVMTTGLAVALVPAVSLTTSASAAPTASVKSVAKGCKTGTLPSEVLGRSAASHEGPAHRRVGLERQQGLPPARHARPRRPS